MDENLQQNQYILILRRTMPTLIRWTKIIFYTIFMFIKNSINYMIDQMRNY